MPQWLIDFAGPDFFYTVHRVTLVPDGSCPAEKQLKWIYPLKGLRRLAVLVGYERFKGTFGSSLKPGGVTDSDVEEIIATFDRLHSLQLSSAQITGMYRRVVRFERNGT